MIELEKANLHLIQRCRLLRIRIIELEEFESQWKALFAPLVARHGPAVKMDGPRIAEARSAEGLSRGHKDALNGRGG
ncbi:MAG: hypothetical protein EOP06_02125 [Proteobacteria bacterium]|nr:MAG: hypothetical protein EOP06_02125 [Pseudomonadota bacterium]